MVLWYVDEGLQTLINEWKQVHPGAIVYTIGDPSHSTNPSVSQHAPDRGGSKPGDDKGEVDAGDFMPGKGGVSEKDLDDLAEGLRKSKDKRLLIVIRRQRIFSSVIDPFNWRPYKGKYHGHTHVSMNDNYDKNTSDWHWEKLVARQIQYKEFTGKLPELMLGDEDANQPGWNHVGRSQALANYLDNSTPDLDVDGVYGKVTAAKFAKALNKSDGRKLLLPDMKKLHGIS